MHETSSALFATAVAPSLTSVSVPASPLPARVTILTALLKLTSNNPIFARASWRVEAHPFIYLCVIARNGHVAKILQPNHEPSFSSTCREAVDNKRLATISGWCIFACAVPAPGPCCPQVGHLTLITTVVFAITAHGPWETARAQSAFLFEITHDVLARQKTIFLSLFVPYTIFSGNKFVCHCWMFSTSVLTFFRSACSSAVIRADLMRCRRIHFTTHAPRPKIQAVHRVCRCVPIHPPVLNLFDSCLSWSSSGSFIVDFLVLPDDVSIEDPSSPEHLAGVA